MSNLEGEVAKLVEQYGADAIKKVLPQRKKGRPAIDDTKVLDGLALWDAMSVIHGRNPSQDLSDNAIATISATYADAPGNSHPSTIRRLRRKLATVDRVANAFHWLTDMKNARSVVRRFLFKEGLKGRFGLDSTADDQTLAAKVSEWAESKLDKNP